MILLAMYICESGVNQVLHTPSNYNIFILSLS